MIYELCQHLGSLRSLWKAPETKTLGGGALSAPPPCKVGLRQIESSFNPNDKEAITIPTHYKSLIRLLCLPCNFNLACFICRQK